MYQFSPSLIKPPRWNVQPHLTAAPELWRGLVGLWPMWERSGGPYEYVTGTGSNLLELTDGGPAPSWQPNVRGSGLRFDKSGFGSGGVVSTDWLEITGGQNRTFFALASLDSGVVGRPRIFEYGESASGKKYGIRADDGDSYRLRFEHGGGFIRGGPDLRGTGLRLLGVRFAGDTLQDATLFVDEGPVSLTGSAGTSTVINTGSAYSALIGSGQLNNAENPWAGDIVIVGMYNYALSDEQWRHLYNNLFAMLRPGPQLLPLLFSDAGATGSTVTDTALITSATSNTLTATDAATATDTATITSTAASPLATTETAVANDTAQITAVSTTPLTATATASATDTAQITNATATTLTASETTSAAITDTAVITSVAATPLTAVETATANDTAVITNAIVTTLVANENTGTLVSTTSTAQLTLPAPGSLTITPQGALAHITPNAGSRLVTPNAPGSQSVTLDAPGSTTVTPRAD